MSDLLTVSYDEKDGVSAIVIARQSDSVTTVIKMATGKKADGIYNLLVGSKTEREEGCG